MAADIISSSVFTSQSGRMDDDEEILCVHEESASGQQQQNGRVQCEFPFFPLSFTNI